MSLAITLLVYVVTGCAAGYLAGLFGVGGGIIIVPVLSFLFEWMGFPHEVYVQLAIGTSMAAVTVTAVFSARAHHNNGNVDWARARWLVPPVIVGVVVGALIGAALPRRALLACVLAFELGVAGLFIYQTLLAKTKAAAEQERPLLATPAFLAITCLLGAVSSIVGIAGGTLFVPFLNLRGMGLRRAIGTAAALGMPIGLVAACLYVATGITGGKVLPLYSCGFVYLPAFLGCIIGGVATSNHGAKLGKRWNVRALKLAFAVVLLIAAAKMGFAMRS